VPSNYEFLVVPNYQYLTRLWLYIALINGGITVENHAKWYSASGYSENCVALNAGSLPTQYPVIQNVTERVIVW